MGTQGSSIVYLHDDELMQVAGSTAANRLGHTTATVLLLFLRKVFDCGVLSSAFCENKI